MAKRKKISRKQKRRESERHLFFAFIFLLSIGMLAVSLYVLNDSGFMTGFAFTAGVNIDSVIVEQDLCIAENGIRYGLECSEIAAESYCRSLSYEGYIDDSKSCGGSGNYAAVDVSQENCEFIDSTSYLEVVRCY